MRTEIRREDGYVKLYLEAENSAESVEIIRDVQLLKKPVRAYGHFDASRTWAWIIIPCKKPSSEYDLTSFGNGGEK